MAANTIDRGRLRRLADVRPERGRVLSLFLNLDPAEFATPPARASAITSILHDAAHKIEACEGLDHDEQEWLRADLERVRSELSATGIAENGTRAVAVYACAPEGLLEVVALRRPIASRVCVDRTPAVEPLVAEADGERWAVLLVNRRSARIFRGTAGDVERHLHAYLRERIAGRLHLDVENSGIEDVRQAVAEALDADQAAQEREALDRLAAGVGRGTRGACGLADVLAALNEARVDTLLVAEGFSAAGRRDTELDLLYAEDAVPPGRPTERVDDVVEAAVEKALDQSSRVLRVSHHPDLGPLGGIGAVLRY